MTILKHIRSLCFAVDSPGAMLAIAFAAALLLANPANAYAAQSESVDLAAASVQLGSSVDNAQSPSHSIAMQSSKKAVSIVKATVSGVVDKHYTGKAHKQNITVELRGKKLRKGKDYTVSYKNNVKVGKAKLIVKGKGGYKGQKTITFVIHKPSYSTCMACIKAAAAAHKSVVKFPTNTVLYSDFKKIVDRLNSNAFSDSPVFMDRYGLSSLGTAHMTWSSDYGEMCTTSVTLNYFLTKGQVVTAQKKVVAVANAAKKKGSSSKIITYLHDYLVKQTAYQTASAQWPASVEAYGYSAYGVLVKHRGYCHGYTVTFVRLLQAAGIKNACYILVTSPGSRYYNDHSMVRIGTHYFDVTWDDPMDPWGRDYGTGVKPSHAYFSKTKTEMQRLGYIF